MEPLPAELLGLRVLDAAGLDVGTVVDVGLVDGRRPKFLLVRMHRGAGLHRVDMRGVALGPDGVRLSGLPPALPS